MLQHGSLIARKYGKPCVAGIQGLTELLKDGDFVEMNGATGLVKKIIAVETKASEEKKGGYHKIRRGFPTVVLLFTLLFAGLFMAAPGTADGDSCIRWLEERAMLPEAAELSGMVSGNGIQWRHPYVLPQTEKFIQTASVWFTAYPPSSQL